MGAEEADLMLQVYTGNGKGKTTAAIGLAVRAAGAGMRVLFVQLMKNVPTSELESLKLLGDRIIVKQFGTGGLIVSTPAKEDYECAEEALAEIRASVTSGRFKMIVADEMCTALYYKLVDRAKVLAIIKECPPSTELVFTGRYADADIIKAADLVTEMREVKHYYQKDISARKGIEY